MVVLEEPDTIIPYVRICGGTGGAIRPPTRLRILGTRRNFGIHARYQCVVVIRAWSFPARASPKPHMLGVSSSCNNGHLRKLKNR